MGYKKDEIERLREELATLQAAHDRSVDEKVALRNTIIDLQNRHRDGKEVARIVADYCNSYSRSHKEFTEQIVSEHRTIQQSVMRLCLQMIEQFSKEGYFDGRNEATVLLARRIVKEFGDDFHLPLV